MGTSPAPPKANGSSRSSGRFKPGGVRPARTGTLTPTQIEAWARPQGSTCAHRSCRAGPGSAAALPTRLGAASLGGPAASEGSSHRGGPSHVPTAGPVLGSTTAERGSGCFQSGCRARLQALLPLSRERSGGPLYAPRPQLPTAGGLLLLGTRPGPGSRPPTAPAQEAAPHPRACTSRPRPVGLTAGSSATAGPATAEAVPSLRGSCLPALCCRPSSSAGPSAGSALSPSRCRAEGIPAPPAPRIPKFSARPSTSRPQDGSKGVCAQPCRQAASAPQGGRLQKLPTRPTEGHPSNLPLLLILSNRFTFSAEALTRYSEAPG